MHLAMNFGRVESEQSTYRTPDAIPPMVESVWDKSKPFENFYDYSLDLDAICKKEVEIMKHS